MPITTIYEAVPPYIDKGTIVKVFDSGTADAKDVLDFEPVPDTGIPAFHNDTQGARGGQVWAYAQLPIDLSALGPAIFVITRVTAQARNNNQPVAGTSSPLAINIWQDSPATLGTHWFDGSGALFHADFTTRKQNETETFDYTPNTALPSGVSSLLLEAAMQIATLPSEEQQNWLAPITLELAVTNIVTVRVQVQLDDGTPVANAPVLLNPGGLTATTGPTGVIIFPLLLADFYTASATLNGFTASASATIGSGTGTITIIFHHPVANFAFSTGFPLPYGVVGSPVSFDGSASSPIDGSITNVFWDFGDGNTLGGTSSSLTLNHTYTVPGTYNVTLTVVNSAGLQSSVTHAIIIVSPLSADFTFSPSNPTVGQTVTITPNISGGLAPYATVIDWGDASGLLPFLTHVYGSAGTFDIGMLVQDGIGQIASATHPITVALNLSVHVKTDTGLPLSATVTISGPVTATATTDTNGIANFPGIPAGTYSISTTVAALTKSETLAISISETLEFTYLEPIADFTTNPTIGFPGITFQLNGSLSSGQGGASLVLAHWDFGDGTSLQGSPAEVLVTLHTYSIEGSFTVSLTIQDNAGLSSSATATLIVSAPPVLAVVLVHRRAWPSKHHFDRAKSTTGTVTLFAELENEASVQEYAVARFQIIRPDMKTDILFSNEVSLRPGQLARVSGDYLPPLDGRYHVTAISIFSTTSPASAGTAGPVTKTFKFAVVS